MGAGVPFPHFFYCGNLLVGKKLWHFWKEPLPERLLGTYSEDEEFLKTADFVVRLESGETIFVPSGWFHQVLNLEDTISVNHNWINEASVQNTWQHLKEELTLVENELEYLHRNGLQNILKHQFWSLFRKGYFIISQ